MCVKYIDMLGLILNGILSLFGNQNGSAVSDQTNYFSRTQDGSGTVDYMGNLMNKITGAGPTGQQMYSNQFAHNEAELAFNRSLMADNTKYQRTVADMAAAGINPMLAANGVGGSSISSPAATPAAGDSANLGGLLSFIVGLRNAAIQKKLGEEQIAVSNKVADAEVKVKEEQAKNIAEDTEGKKIVNLFNSETVGLRKEALELSNSLSKEQADTLVQNRNESVSRVKKIAAETETEASKKAYYTAAAILENAKAWQIAELTPYEKAYKSATTQAAKDAAALSAAHCAYQNGLIEKGYLDAFIDKAIADAGISASHNEVEGIKAAIRTGRWSGDGIGKAVASAVLTPLAIILDNFNPIKFTK